jgi:hypothetical protein
MNSLSKELNKSNNESDYIIFSLKNNKNFKNKEIIESMNKTSNHFSINKNKADETKEEKKLPFTNSIIREKIKVSKIKDSDGNINNGKKEKNIDTNKKHDNYEEFLSIYRLLNINSKSAIKKIKNNTKSKSFDNKKIIIRNLSNNNQEKANNIIIPNLLSNKISVGQQTLINSISKTVNSDYQSKNMIVNIPIHSNPIKKDAELKRQDIKNYQSRNYLAININNANLNKEKFIRNITLEDKTEDKKDEEITDYMNYINFPKFMNDYKNINKTNQRNKQNISNTINLSELYGLSKKKYFINKTHRLFRNKSNIVNFNNVKLEEKINTMSIRELYRNLSLLHKNKEKQKKFKSVFKNKRIIEYLNKNSDKIENETTKRFNNNLVSLENYTKKIKLSKNTNQNLKLKKNKNKTSTRDLNLLSYKKYFGTIDKNMQDNENFFSNILKSFSRVNERINKNKMKVDNRNFLINIQTMIELNNKSNKI